MIRKVNLFRFLSFLITNHSYLKLFLHNELLEKIYFCVYPLVERGYETGQLERSFLIFLLLVDFLLSPDFIHLLST